jgi:hypothetical protein
VTEPAERLAPRTPFRRAAWDRRQFQLVAVVLGLLALTPMTWREKTVTNVKPVTSTGLRLDLVPSGLLLYLSIALAIALAILPLRRPWSKVIAAAGVAATAALLLTQPGDTSVTAQSFTQVTHYEWWAPPVVSLVFWVILLALTVKAENRQLHRAVLLLCGVALPVLMTADWQRFAVNGQVALETTGFGLLAGASHLWAALLIAPMAVMVAVILLPARTFAATLVAAAGLVLTLANLLVGLPNSVNSTMLEFSWLPAAYLSVPVWLIALATTIHARLVFRG